MYNTNSSKYILHVSDFHLSDKENECAESALKALAEKLKTENIKVDYLLHTGDIIDSSDIYEEIASELDFCESYYEYENKNKRFDFKQFTDLAKDDQKKVFDAKLKEKTSYRFEKAESVLRVFVSKLNVSLGNVVICCGNHDIMRPSLPESKSLKCDKTENCNVECEFKAIFDPFKSFLKNLEVANWKDDLEDDLRMDCKLGNLNILILNTNWVNPNNLTPGYHCVNCKQVENIIKNANDKRGNKTLNIIMAHKPIYEICEKARLSYKRYIKTPFMSEIQEFIGENGIYLCGDKHTRSIVGASFHDIPHYIGGEPLTIKNNDTKTFEVEYNLLEIVGNKLGMERKIHLKSEDGVDWECLLRPQDNVVTSIYKNSKDYLIKNALKLIASPGTLNTWENICQVIYGWNPDERNSWLSELNIMFRSICKYREAGSSDDVLDKIDDNIFVFVSNCLEKKINANSLESVPINLLNIRGENSSGKSTFLCLLYVYLLYKYSIGLIDFIPAYFNLDNNKILKKIQDNISYHDAVKQLFSDFTKNIRKISEKERQPICYIIDGFDEQDCWSYSSEDSIGRGVLDVLSENAPSYYIMAFSQHRLPSFKNTMPLRKYNDLSDIMYFNPIDVRESGAKDNRFIDFVDSFLKLTSKHLEDRDDEFTFKYNELDKEKKEIVLKNVCNLIRSLRRLTINPGFMLNNNKYITAIENPDCLNLKYQNKTVDDTYRDYIDRQCEICLESMGYGFVHYAPAMAFLFSYKGYTYERFERLQENKTHNNEHVFKPIYDNSDKIYGAFQFIKKDNDAREFLIALHYNRELRYYAENPSEEIDEDSILNEYIVRNIAVTIRKLWNDTNKFIIVCEKLLERDDLSCCLQSMLIYCLAHQSIYSPTYCKLRERMFNKGLGTLGDHVDSVDDYALEWEIQGENDAVKLQKFINLSLKHAMIIFGEKSGSDLIKLFINNDQFCCYNRQYQMLYYGDLSILGEEKKNLLNPGVDTIYKGFDFHNCYNYLYVKLSSNLKYPLREFDMCTLWDMIYSRLSIEYANEHSIMKNWKNTFFYREVFTDKSNKVLEQTYEIFDDYLKMHSLPNKENAYFKVIKYVLGKVIEYRRNNDFHTDSSRIKELLDSFPRTYEKFLKEIEKKDDDLLAND